MAMSNRVSYGKGSDRPLKANGTMTEKMTYGTGPGHAASKPDPVQVKARARKAAKAARKARKR